MCGPAPILATSANDGQTGSALATTSFGVVQQSALIDGCVRFEPVDRCGQFSLAEAEVCGEAAPDRC